MVRPPCAEARRPPTSSAMAWGPSRHGRLSLAQSEEYHARQVCQRRGSRRRGVWAGPARSARLRGVGPSLPTWCVSSSSPCRSKDGPMSGRAAMVPSRSWRSTDASRLGGGSTGKRRLGFQSPSSRPNGRWLWAGDASLLGSSLMDMTSKPISPSGLRYDTALRKARAVPTMASRAREHRLSLRSSALCSESVARARFTSAVRSAVISLFLVRSRRACALWDARSCWRSLSAASCCSNSSFRV
mmetsp:Transcript_65103/g.169405  ORF Transcript_65103/g.169405 Transcript_65103/m.169405 type:complete len:243 (-) Transcript_65103:438-1166(-)